MAKAAFLRRSDMRLLVGAGAAAAISTAYSAPIAGMLYAFELVLGLLLHPECSGRWGLAAIVSSLLARAIQGGDDSFRMAPLGDVHWPDYPLAILIGGVAAGVGVRDNASGLGVGACL